MYMHLSNGTLLKTYKFLSKISLKTFLKLRTKLECMYNEKDIRLEASRVKDGCSFLTFS